MSQEDEKKFSIQQAAELSGLSAHTIRAWEKRYQALTPKRTMNGRRLYNSLEVDRLIMLSQLTHLGSNISQIAHLKDEDLKAMYAKLVQNGEMYPQLPRTMPSDIDLTDVREKLIAAVEGYKVDVISQLLSHAKNSVTPKTFALQILEPLISEVNRRKEQRVFQNAQLQTLYAIAKFHAGNIIYSHFEKSQKSTQKFVLTSLEKEHHTFPLLISALLCCHHKKHFFYLNSNLPAVSIIDAAKATEATVLMLNVSPYFENHSEVTRLLDQVIEALSQKIKIWLIGNFDPEKIKVDRWKNTIHIKDHSELDELLSSTL